MLLNRFSTLTLKLLLLYWGSGFYVNCQGQNILANPSFEDAFRCCEENKRTHMNGWFYVGAYHKREVIKKKAYLNVAGYNAINKYNSYLIGSFIKPISSNHTYKIRIKLLTKKSFFLHCSSFRFFNIEDNQDSSMLKGLAYQQLLIKNKSYIEFTFQPAIDSCNYLVLKFEDIQNTVMKGPTLRIDFIELIDTTEDKQNLPLKYQERLKEIYAETRRHDYTVPCNGNQTLRR